MKLEMGEIIVVSWSSPVGKAAGKEKAHMTSDGMS